MLIYIASPYTLGDQALNVRRQIAVAEKLLEMGHIPVVPCLFHLWHLIYPKSYEEWMRIGAAHLGYCDAILRLPGESPGADMEMEQARQNRQLIYRSLEEIPNVLS